MKYTYSWLTFSDVIFVFSRTTGSNIFLHNRNHDTDWKIRISISLRWILLTGHILCYYCRYSSARFSINSYIQNFQFVIHTSIYRFGGKTCCVFVVCLFLQTNVDWFEKVFSIPIWRKTIFCRSCLVIVIPSVERLCKSQCLWTIISKFSNLPLFIYHHLEHMFECCRSSSKSIERTPRV